MTSLRIAVLLSFFVACQRPMSDSATVDSATVDSATDAASLPVVCPTSLPDPTGVHEDAPVLVPSGAMPPDGWPLIVASHGYAGSNLDAVWRAGLASVESWAVVITPNGLRDPLGNRYTHANDECCDRYKANPDDVGWYTALLHEMKAACRIDASQVYAIGISNGGYMAEAIACADPQDIVAAIGESDAPPSHCGRPIWLRKTHGTADRHVPYEGGAVLPVYAPSPAADDPAPYGCTGFVATGEVAAYDGYVAAAMSARYVATGCEPGTDVELWRMETSGHTPAWTKAWWTDATAWLHAHVRAVVP